MADMADMAETPLRTMTRTQGNNQALKDGTVSPDGYSFAFEDVPVLVQGFRRMVRDLEFDVSEMAFTTYLCAKAHGKRMTALPVFLVRGFHHGAILGNSRGGIRNPKDLEGQKVGVNRGYTVTTGVWARAILQDEYGVDLSKVTWVLSGDEHVAEYRPPDNVVSIGDGQGLESMLVDGELAATIGVSIDHPDVGPLIPDPVQAGFAALRDRGLYPINHLVVVRDDVLEAHPDLAAAVFDAFAEAKDVYVDRLRREAIEEPTPADVMYQRVLEITGADPLPYGIGPNLPVIEQLIGHAVTQRILDRPVPVESLFAKGTHDLTRV
jgi:4,5-dihydroxyphthalate decarboxylase